MIEFLQRFDFDWLILLMKVFTFLGEEQFYLLLLPILLWCWKKIELLPLVIILLLNFIANYEFKEFFQQPRPDITLRLIAVEGYGFPSGHAQAAVVLWGYLAWILSRKDRRAAWGWAGLLIFFIGFSRIYLGVHFPADVAGGWAIGFCLLFLGLAITEWIRKARLEFPAVPSALLVGFSGLMSAVLWPSDISMRAGGMLAGLGSGLILEKACVAASLRAGWWRQVLKVGLGLAGILLLKSGLKVVFPAATWADWIRYGALGLWIGLGVPWVSKSAGLTDD